MALLACPGAQQSVAAEPPTVMVLFDGSGSMWGKPDGWRQAKLYAARDALRAALDTTPPMTRLGLASFGHRRAGDCSDAEVILDPAPLALERLMTPIEKLNPRGRGPITTALRALAPHLGPKDAPASVILVHDDRDNCQLDPCSAVADLRQAHPGVRVHVISLAPKPEDAEHISCLPKATAGRHFVVATQEELAPALAEAMRLATAMAPATPKATPPKDPVPKAGPGAAGPADTRPGVALGLRLAEGGPLLQMPARWRVTRAGAADAAPVWVGDAAAPLLVLPTGRYLVEAWLGQVAAKGTVEAVAGERRTLDMTLAAGTIRVADQDGSEAAPLRAATVTVRRVDGTGPAQVAIVRGVPGDLVVAAGSYLVTVTVGPLRIDRGFIVRPGDRLGFQPPLRFGTVDLDVLPATGAAPLAEALIVVYEDDPDAPQGRREIARTASAPARLTLPAGTYYVVARAGSAEARERISVRPGAVDRLALVLGQARLSLLTRLPGTTPQISEPVSHVLERLDVEPHEFIRASRPGAELGVAAGRYRLVTRIGAGNVVIERAMTLAPGARERVVIEPPAGRLRLRLIETPGGNPLTDVAWDVRDSTGRTVWLANAAQAQPLLLAGRYRVTATARRHRAEREVDVRPGETRSLDLEAPAPAKP